MAAPIGSNRVGLQRKRASSYREWPLVEKVTVRAESLHPSIVIVRDEQVPTRTNGDASRGVELTGIIGRPADVPKQHRHPTRRRSDAAARSKLGSRPSGALNGVRSVCAIADGNCTNVGHSLEVAIGGDHDRPTSAQCDHEQYHRGSYSTARRHQHPRTSSRHRVRLSS
jgi:hypothetical protein